MQVAHQAGQAAFVAALRGFLGDVERLHRLSSAYRRPTGAVRHLADTAEAVFGGGRRAGCASRDTC